MESLFEHSRKVFCFADEITVLYKRFTSSRDVSFLKDISAEKVGTNLTCNGNNRNRVRIGGCNACDEVGCTGTGSCHANTGTITASCIAACRMSSVLFLTNKNVGNARIVNFIVKWANSRTGITKDYVKHFTIISAPLIIMFCPSYPFYCEQKVFCNIKYTLLLYR